MSIEVESNGLISDSITAVQEVFFPGIPEKAINEDRFQLYLDATIYKIQKTGLTEVTTSAILAMKEEIEAIVEVTEKEIKKPTAPVCIKSKIGAMVLIIVLVLLATKNKKLGKVGVALIGLVGIGIWKGDKYLNKINIHRYV